MKAYIYNSHNEVVDVIDNIKRINSILIQNDEFGNCTLIFYQSNEDMLEHNFFFNEGESVSFDNDEMVEG